MKKIISTLLICTLLLLPVNAFAASPRYGIDISKHNGSDVDFAQQMSEGNSFVMIRLGNYNIIDAEFMSNVRKASEAGIDFGVYMYSAAFNDDEARIEAQFTLDTLASLPEEYKKHFTMPVAYDMEASGLKDFSREQLTRQVVIFSEMMIKSGYIPMVYANLDWFTHRLDINAFADKGYKIWLANYTSNPDFSSKKQVGNSGVYADMWQYQMGDAAKGTLDRNFIYNPSSLAHLYRQSCKSRATLKANGSVVEKCIACGRVKSEQAVYKPASFTLSSSAYAYNGSARKPAVTIKDSRGNRISAENYSVKYSNNTKVGKASVKITFKNLYSGTKTIAFKINPKGTAISSLKPASRAVTVKWKKQTTQTRGYQLQYSTSSKFTSPTTVTIAKNSTVSRKISGLKGNKKYYIRIRTYSTVSGAKYYSAWSGIKSFVTKK